MGIMKEEELLKWIDETLSGTRSVISHLAMNAQMMPLDLMEEKAYRNADRQIAILNELKRVVINWYQGREAVKEG